MSAVTGAIRTVRTWVVNPVLRREMVERWRGRRAFTVVTVYVALLTAVMLLLYWLGNTLLDQEMRFGGGNLLSVGPAMGRFLFENLLAFVMLLVLFIAPGYAAAQISGERERRTLALLQITLVRPSAIVAGKLAASVAWLLLLVVAALPFGAMAFFLGGVSLADLSRGVLTILVVAVSIAAMGLGVSSATRKTTASVIITYALVLMFVFGTLFAALIEFTARRLDQEFAFGARPVALIANPYYGLSDAVRTRPFGFFGGGELPSVLTPFASILPGSELGGGMPQREPVVIDDVVADDPFVAPRREPVWLRTLAVFVVGGALGFVVAARRVRAGKGPRRRRKNGKRPAAVPVPAEAALLAPPDPSTRAEMPFVNGEETRT